MSSVACPIKPAERRLSDSQAYWNLAADAYQEPDVFIRHTQATIQALRIVTWLLQKAKQQLPGFEAWYGVCQERMSSDRVLKWLVDMRNHIEKRGDMEPGSSLHMESRMRQSNPPSGGGVFLMHCRHDGNRRGWRSEAAKLPRDQTAGGGIGVRARVICNRGRPLS